MILAGFVLLAVGATDLVRQFVPRRWIGFVVAAAVVLLLGIGGDALLPALLGLGAGALWAWSMPDEGPSRAGFWPAVALAALSIAAVVWGGSRSTSGLIGELWTLRSPFGEVPFDLAVLALGAGVFLLESANLVVRAALDGEHTWRPAEVSGTVAPEPVPSDRSEADAPAVSAVIPADPRHGFKGGRLIGPLERVLVMILTLAAAYPVLAAMLAAKGIVRFPEISRDGETGARAEYFLVGSLVSWVIGLGAAFLVWWAAHS
ncbi:hypothetical protein D8M34_16555 [Microbacterium sp. HSID17254]|jgi:hypothetical protein|uniref:Uncharacterized protein n=1 Tax=Microbacterium paraoxydans TaxID=199592 RepID=A0ABZ2HQ52_9MICO|nr:MULTISPECIES: hypothetical protein [Microbacterium]AMG81989.1 hypothetical protein AXH82_00325 [Microbacterium sp. PAMC 28756]OSP10480.1 hypothetical protein B7W94_00475 [Microbacterium sp. LEMMJ01]QXE28859.1 hypothetical protein IZR02_10690 [Microbacterium paraoxydans]RUQ03423.1 hypothetical protein D8M34_16555 [Microbacterium sp. HSID17254]